MFMMQPGRDHPVHFTYEGRPFCFGPYQVTSTYPPGLLAGAPPRDLVFKGIKESLDRWWPGGNLFLEPTDEGPLPSWVVKVVLFSTPIEEPPADDASFWDKLTAPCGSDFTLCFMVKDHAKPMEVLVCEAMTAHGLVWKEHATDWAY